MKTILNDPLLTVARLGTILVQIGLIIGQIALGVAIAVTVIGLAGWLPENDQVQFSRTTWATTPHGVASIAMAAVLVSLGLMTDFVIRVRQIIDTVAEGDPFVTDNARRLTRMGWLALGVQALALAVTVLTAFANSSALSKSFEIHSEASFTGLALALVLFILARVFRQGAAMRDDLEGTV